MKNRIIICLLFLSLLSCKKDKEVVDTCTNGYLDPGETKIDCGGKCTPCPVVYYPSLSMKLNGNTVSFNNKSLSLTDSTYYLQFNNDSLSMFINLGKNENVGTFSLGTGTKLIWNGINYTNFSYSVGAISSNDKTNKRMSGFFEVQFDTGNPNTSINITSGSFADLTY